MTLFNVLYVRRSDGKLEVVTKTQREPNQPTVKQLDPTPDAKGVSDYYRKIGDDEVKSLDWRRKLGGMLMRELGGKDYQDKAYMLDGLPENYRLYEHIKSKAGDADGKAKKSTKNHAGGGHDRQDAYLYGHPLGRKKRFRSPADFFPHLLWLATDESGDPNNCTCKICSPEEIQVEDKTTAAKQVKQEQTVKKEETQQKSIITGRNPTVEIPRRPSSQGAPNAGVRSSPSTSAVPLPITSPTPLPQPRSIDQQIDTTYNKMMFRTGEVIWFNRGVAWGLGVIVRRYLLKNTPHQDIRAYVVQPLSHPFAHPPQVTITQEDMCRPWLAWSAPPYTNGALNEIKVTYDTADWQGILEKRYGQGDAEVDGSILAARAIDATYTLFDIVKKYKSETGAEERHWNGMYVGGEKVWVGEPVRLRTVNGTDVMVVNNIIEKIPESSAGRPAQTTITIVGDVYAFITVIHGQQRLPDSSHLPRRMREDLDYRNSITIPTKRTASYWKLTQALGRFDISEIKGRWYESSLLLPMLLPTFDQEIQRGEINDAGLWMNARGDASSTQKTPGVRKPERIDALGRAVPPNTRIMSGVEPPPAEEMAMDLSSGGMDISSGPAEPQQDQMMHDAGHGALEEFMNLDGMEHDSMPGFGQEYGAQDQGGQGYV